MPLFNNQTFSQRAERGWGGVGKAGTAGVAWLATLGGPVPWSSISPDSIFFQGGELALSNIQEVSSGTPGGLENYQSASCFVLCMAIHK